MSVQTVTITMPIAGITTLVITNVGTRGPMGPTGPTGPTGADGVNGADRTVKSTSFTAANGTGYVSTATLTVTDPAGVEGKGYSVLVAAGTSTIGGTVYATAGTIVERVYQNSAWASYSSNNITSSTTSNGTATLSIKRIEVTGDDDADAMSVTALGNNYGANIISDSATAISATSTSGSGLFAKTTSGTYHATFGETGNDQSFVARIDGAFGWVRGNYTGRIKSADTLTGNWTWTLPDKSGTVAMTSDIPTALPASDVYSWAKASAKPSYTASEVSAARAIETKTTDFTAVVGGRYIVESAGKISITDPTGTTAGESYEVWIGSGTIWFNGAGTVYSASRFSIRRRYTGSAWATPSPVVTDALQVGATNTWDGSTITGAQTMSGQLQLTGQSATDANSAMTRGLVDVNDRRWSEINICNFTGATNAKSGGASESATVGYISGSSGATNGNYNTYRIGSYLAPVGQSYQTVNFSKRVRIAWRIVVTTTTSTAGESRYLWPCPIGYTTGRMTQKGIGVLVIGHKVYGHTHDGSTARVTTAYVDAGGNYIHEVSAESDGAGNVSFYVNGTFLETLTGPTGTQATARCAVVNSECVDSTAVWFTAISFSLKQEL